MKLKWNRMLLVVLVLTALVLVAGCSGEQTPYEKNDADNYKISVKYDANGGVFTTSTTVIVDSFNADNAPKDENGMAQIALITPDDAARGNNAFKAERTGYFLAGWYAKCETAEDGTQTFAEPWDFAADRLSVDPKAKHSATEPVLTLYAAWVPLYQVEFYDRANTAEPLKVLTLDPGALTLQVPAWDEETGAMEMGSFPAVENKTFSAAYYDAEGKQPITEATITHSAQLNVENATVQAPVMKIYMDMVDGTWFHIYNTDQFIKNARLSGSYVLHADLDFTDKIWPSALMYGTYTGEIVGNGHTISNVALEQTNNSKVNAGLFGALSENAKISDLTFQNVTFTIKAGTRVAGTSYGLLAGAITEGATLENLAIKSSKIVVDAQAYFGTDDYVIGTVCGMGEVELEIAEITLDDQRPTE